MINKNTRQNDGCLESNNSERANAIWSTKAGWAVVTKIGSAQITSAAGTVTAGSHIMEASGMGVRQSISLNSSADIAS